MMTFTIIDISPKTIETVRTFLNESETDSQDCKHLCRFPGRLQYRQCTGCHILCARNHGDQCSAALHHSGAALGELQGNQILQSLFLCSVDHWRILQHLCRHLCCHGGNPLLCSPFKRMYHTYNKSSLMTVSRRSSYIRDLTKRPSNCAADASSRLDCGSRVCMRNHSFLCSILRLFLISDCQTGD